MKKIIIAFTIAVVATVVAICSPVRSMLGADGAELIPEGDTGPTAADYIQDGLIAMWDGIENVGWGVHDDNSAVWVDLVGDKNATLTAAGSFSDMSLVCDGTGYAARDGYVFNRSSVRQVECCFYSQSNGIMATVANGSSQNSYDSIRLQVSNPNIMVMNVGAASAGLKNYTRLPQGVEVSASFGYSDRDFVDAVVNGTRQTIGYQFTNTTLSRIAFGGRSENSDVPWKGEIFCMRIYNRNLTDEEILHNYEIDRERFGLP